MTEISSAGRVLVGVDGSPGSKWALAWAVRAAEQEGAGLDVVAAWDHTTSWSASPLPADYSARVQRQRAVFAAVDEVLWAARPADVRIVLRRGSATEALVEKSRGALLLVVGTTGRRGLGRLVHGSVSRRVAARARCPVLVVRPLCVPDVPVMEPIAVAR
jgi:nucleotide-binding universal stress UspA family protein